MQSRPALQASSSPATPVGLLSPAVEAGGASLRRKASLSLVTHLCPGPPGSQAPAGWGGDVPGGGQRPGLPVDVLQDIPFLLKHRLSAARDGGARQER